MTEFTQQLREHSLSVGADLISIAPVERFAELPAERHPQAIFPEARSVIVIGKRITRGALRGVEEGTQFASYGMFGRDWLNNRVLATSTFMVAEFIEKCGWEAVPLPNLPPETPPMGISVDGERPAPNVLLDFDDAAVRAGMGEIGYCGLLLTPQFGPRQRIQLVLTDAELKGDPVLADPICRRCREHASFCPLGAIDPDLGRDITICGKLMRVAKVDYAKCATCKNGAAPNNLHPSGNPDRIAALCTRSCISYLESNGRVSNTFHNPFRTREPWGIIEERRTL